MALTPKAVPQEIDLPDFIQAINNDYKSQLAHVFLLHGNIYDFCDNSGKDQTVKQMFISAFDDNFQKSLVGENSDRVDLKGENVSSKTTRILVTYNLSQGLDYPNPQSFEMMKSAMKASLGDDAVNDEFMRPKGVGQLIKFMNLWFEIAKSRKKNNFTAKKQGKSLQEELSVIWLITDADALFPAGEIANLGQDRLPIVAIRQWAQDELLALNNRIILLCRHASDLHESIRSEISAIHLARKPNLEDRKQYIINFDRTIQLRAKQQGGSISIGKTTNVSKINWADDFGADACAIQSAGMNRRQLKDVFLKSWMIMEPVGYDSVRERKQRALQDEYQGMIDFKEPEFGFEEIGGHESFKKFCKQQIIIPLQSGDKRTCARGALLCGPPGTGKSTLAWALAKEAKMNYLVVDLSKVFGGLVGESLYGNQEIYFSDKLGRHIERKTIREAYETGHLPYTVAFSEFGGLLIREVTDVIRHDRQEKFVKITTRRGKEVIVTEGHSVFTRASKKSEFGKTKASESGYLTTVAAGTLTPGIPLATIGYWNSPDKRGSGVLNEVDTQHLKVKLSVPLMELIGFYLGDGSKHGGSLRLSLGPGDKEIVDLLRQFGEVSEDKDPRSQAINYTLHTDGVYTILQELGVAGKHRSSYNKRVPAWVLGASDEHVAALLRGYFSTDGSFSGHNLEATSASGELAEDISLLLSRFGIASRLDWRYVKSQHRYHRRVTVSKGAELAMFASEIGFVQKYKNTAISFYLDKIGEEITSRGKGKHKHRYSICWDEVAKVEPFESDDPYSYDLCVPGPQNFMSSGIVLHNTESNMRKLLEAIEAAAPCIVFVDELDSVLSAGRTSAGDSGTSGRVFNSFMTFMSDPSRAGKICVLAATNRPDLLDAALIRAGRFDAKIAILPPSKDDEKGRYAILKALITKHKVLFDEAMSKTKNDPLTGLGRLLKDNQRVWTGAEIEVVMKKAISTAAFADRKDADGQKDYTITLDDWNHAMDVIIPNTNEVEYQTKLALYFVDDLDFVPSGWVSLAKDKDALRKELGLSRNTDNED